MCLKSLAGILPQKFLTKLSNSLNFGGCEGTHCTKLFHCKSRDKMLSNELYQRFFRQKLISVAQLKIRCAENFRLCAKNEKKKCKIFKMCLKCAKHVFLRQKHSQHVFKVLEYICDHSQNFVTKFQHHVFFSYSGVLDNNVLAREIFRFTKLNDKYL